MIIAATGSRPNKIGGYAIPNPIYSQICKATEKIFLELKPEKVISGMALGYDQYFANTAWKLHIPFIAAVPMDGQERIWSEIDQKRYRKLISRADEVYVVNPGEYSPWKMQKRNEWMVLNCDLLLACWDGTEGGTKNCIDFAKKIGRDIKYLEYK